MAAPGTWGWWQERWEDDRPLMALGRRHRPLRTAGSSLLPAHTHLATPTRMDGQSHPQRGEHTSVPIHHSPGSCHTFQQMFPTNCPMWIIPEEQQVERSPPKRCQRTEAGKRRFGAQDILPLFTKGRGMVHRR